MILLKILFWDIDGTLMRTGKAGLYALAQAAAEIYDFQVDFEKIISGGMTDCHIASQIILQATGSEASLEEAEALVRRYLELLPGHMDERQGFLIPPVRELLQHIHGLDGYTSLLLTGNTAAGAKIKLAKFGIDHFFDFSASGFGDGCLDRSQVASNAMRGMHKLYPGASPDEIFIIGDTPNDVRCGKLLGVRTVAVATGKFSCAELESHSPWWVTETLPSPEEFLRMLGEGPAVSG